ncbi:MAG TPA: hypothetical protein VFT89_12340 [Rhizobiaceae bacterium]|nr:hypothetical protein [Rhizobiaceae bacterium]
MLHRPRRSDVLPAGSLLRLTLLCLVCLSILPTPLNAAVTIIAAASTSADEGEDRLPGKYATVAKARVTPIVISGRPGKQDWQASHDGGDPATCVLYTFTVANPIAAWRDAGNARAVVASQASRGARAPPE